LKIKGIISFSVLLFYFSIFAEYPWKNNTVYILPKGHVNFVSIKTYLINNDIRSLQQYEMMYISKSKAERELYSYKPDDTLIGMTVVEDNSEGYVTSYREYDGNRELLWKVTIHYNDDNQMTKHESCKKGDDTCKVYLYYYDSENRIIKKEIFTKYPMLRRYTVIEYGKNRKKTSRFYPQNIENNNSFIEIYDSDGNNIEFIAYDSNRKVTSKYITKYDSNKNKIEEKVNHFLIKESYTYTYKYIDRKNERSKITYKNSKLIENETKVFDGNRVVSHLVEEYKDGEIIESELQKYDEIGNVILKRTFEDNRTLETIYEYEYVD
jgi:hypothetical protein